MEDSRSNNIQERAKEAKKTWSGSRSGPWFRLSIPAKMNPNSLLLEAVDVARVARDALGPAKDFDKKAKRAGLLALYKTNEDMVKDFSNNVQDFRDVDVVACTDGKEEMFKELEKGIKEKEGCWCYWAHHNGQFPTKSFFMYTFMDMVGKTPPLVDENRATRALVVCVAIEGIRTGKTGRKLDLLEELKQASSAGFRMWCALTACGTVGEKEAACFSDMKIPTLFQLPPLNGSANASTITTGPAQIMPTNIDDINGDMGGKGNDVESEQKSEKNNKRKRDDAVEDEAETKNELKSVIPNIQDEKQRKERMRKRREKRERDEKLIDEGLKADLLFNQDAFQSEIRRFELSFDEWKKNQSDDLNKDVSEWRGCRSKKDEELLSQLGDDEKRRHWWCHLYRRAVQELAALGSEVDHDEALKHVVFRWRRAIQSSPVLQHVLQHLHKVDEDWGQIIREDAYLRKPKEVPLLFKVKFKQN